MTSDPPASPDVGRLIERLHRECATAEGVSCPGVFKRENWCARCEAADALAALQARETREEPPEPEFTPEELAELRADFAAFIADREGRARMMQLIAEASITEPDTLKHALEDWQRWREDVPALSIRAEQAEAEAASLRQEVERLKTEQTRADIYGEVVAKWRPIVQEAEALRQALKWAMDYAERELRSQHIHKDDKFETCTSPQCVRYREVLASVDPLPVSKEIRSQKK